MTIEVITKDCTALTDAEMSDMADLDRGRRRLGGRRALEAGRGVGARDAGFAEGQLRGFAFSTLERIGGTPAISWGCARIGRNKTRATRR